MRLVFNIYKNNALVRRQELTGKDVFKIGKLPSSDVKLDGDDVSRMHAVIERIGDEAYVIDLGSASGTFVNDKMVNKGKLKSCDVLRVGAFCMEVVFSEEGVSLPDASPTLEGVEYYPEHEKLKALGGKNDVVGRFIEWLRECGYEICTLSDDQPRTYRERGLAVFVPVHKSTEQLLAEHFEIDTKKLNAEKDAMLASLRKATQKAGLT